MCGERASRPGPTDRMHRSTAQHGTALLYSIAIAVNLRSAQPYLELGMFLLECLFFSILLRSRARTNTGPPAFNSLSPYSVILRVLLPRFRPQSDLKREKEALLVSLRMILFSPVGLVIERLQTADGR